MISIEPPMASDDDIAMLEACAIANAAFHANLGEEGVRAYRHAQDRLRLLINRRHGDGCS